MTRPPTWITSSFGHAADTLPVELSALGEHYDVCRTLSGPLFALRCAGEAVHRFVSTRVLTTLLVAAFLIGGAAMAL
jgi:hypothetical protein